MKPIDYILLFTILLSGCSLDDNYIRQREWKCDNTMLPLPDRFSFGGGYVELRHDTVFVLDSAIAKLIKTKKSLFGNNEMQLKSLGSEEIVKYLDLGPLKPEDTIVQITLTPPPPVEEVPPPPPPLPPKNN